MLWGCRRFRRACLRRYRSGMRGFALNDRRGVWGLFFLYSRRVRRAIRLGGLPLFGALGRHWDAKSASECTRSGKFLLTKNVVRAIVSKTFALPTDQASPPKRPNRLLTPSASTPRLPSPPATLRRTISGPVTTSRGRSSPIPEGEVDSGSFPKALPVPSAGLGSFAVCLAEPGARQGKLGERVYGL